MSESRERDEPAPSANGPESTTPKASEVVSEVRPNPAKDSEDTQEPRAVAAEPREGEDSDEGDDSDEDEDSDEEEEDEDSDEEAAEDAASSERPNATGGEQTATEEGLWGSVARSVVLSAVIGFALATWAQMAFGGRWATDLLADNTLPPGQRVTMIKASLGGAVLVAAAIGYVSWTRLRKHQNVLSIERWLWFASPLMLLPALASVFRYKPWVDQHARLLPIVLFLTLVAEVLIFRALRACPPRVLVWWEDLRQQIPEFVKKRGPLLLVVAGVVFYVGFFSFYLLRWHYKLRTGNFDLSINNNLMYGGLHGRFLESPVVFPQDPPKYLANHAKFGGYLFLPIYALYPRAETLLVLQSTLIGISALPLWGFARRHLSEWMATVVTVAYLLYYPMHGASFSEFQYVPIAGFFVLTTVWAAETRRWLVFWVVFATGILMREDIPVGMVIVGGFLLLSGYRPVQGLVMAALAGAYFLFLRFYVMEEAGQWWFPNMYKELWADGEKGFRSVIKTLLSNPLYVLSKITVEKKLLYLMHLLVPLAFLPARRWYLWAAFVPGTVLTLLVTNYDPPITFSFHYVMHWTPYLFLGSVLALKAIGNDSFFGDERRRAAAAAMFGASLVLSYNYGAFPQRSGSFKGGFQRVEFSVSDAERQRYADLQTLMAMIPKDASVAATEKLGPHLSSRVHMYTMRHGPQNAEWVVASSRELKLSRTRPKLFEVVNNGDYGVVKRIADLALLKRGHDTSGNERLIREWRLSDQRPPTAAERARPADNRKEAEPEQKSPEGEPDPNPPE